MSNKQERTNEVRVNERDRGLGAVLDRHLVPWLEADGGSVVRMNLKNKGAEWLLVLELKDEAGDRWVAFVSGESPASCFRIAGNKAQQSSLKWNESRPWAG